MSTRSVLIILVAFAILLVFCGPSTVAFVFVKWKFRNSPELWIVPKPLLPVPTQPVEGPKLSYFGYEFDSPVAQAKEGRRVESMVTLDLSDCAVMTIFKPQPAGEMIRAMQQEAVKEGRDITGAFGEKASRSEYAFRSQTLSVTPRDVRFLSSPREIVGNSVLLQIKSIELQRFKNGLYSFETAWMRGFQEGDLKRDKGVVIEAYDKQDRRLMLIVGARPGKTCFSQPDLNRIIFSLKPAAPSQ